MHYTIVHHFQHLSGGVRYVADPAEMDAIVARKPWKEDVKYFRRVRVSAVALVRTGGAVSSARQPPYCKLQRAQGCCSAGHRRMLERFCTLQLCLGRFSM